MTKKQTLSRAETSKARAAERRRKLVNKLHQMRFCNARLAQICANIKLNNSTESASCRLEISSKSQEEKEVKEVKGDDQVMGFAQTSNTEASSAMSSSENLGSVLPSFTFDEDADMPLLFHDTSSDLRKNQTQSCSTRNR